MSVRYTCRHCKTEIGSIPFESAKETIALLERADKEEEEESYLVSGNDGKLTIRCICEQCQQALRKFPSYYTFNKWLQ